MNKGKGEKKGKSGTPCSEYKMEAQADSTSHRCKNNYI